MRKTMWMDVTLAAGLLAALSLTAGVWPVGGSSADGRDIFGGQQTCENWTTSTVCAGGTNTKNSSCSPATCAVNGGTVTNGYGVSSFTCGALDCGQVATTNGTCAKGG
jgi:hypothetical protein